MCCSCLLVIGWSLRCYHGNQGNQTGARYKHTCKQWFKKNKKDAVNDKKKSKLRWVWLSMVLHIIANLCLHFTGDMCKRIDFNTEFSTGQAITCWLDPAIIHSVQCTPSSDLMRLRPVDSSSLWRRHAFSWIGGQSHHCSIKPIKSCCSGGNGFHLELDFWMNFN